MIFIGNPDVDGQVSLATPKESRTPKETQSESTRLSDFLIIAWLKLPKLVHCCILFIKKCLCYVFRKLSNTHTKLKFENHSSVSILTAFFWCFRLYQRRHPSSNLKQHRYIRLLHFVVSLRTSECDLVTTTDPSL